MDGASRSQEGERQGAHTQPRPQVITSLQVSDWLEMLTTLVYAASARKQLLHLSLLPVLPCVPSIPWAMAIGVIAGMHWLEASSARAQPCVMERLE